MLILLSPAKTLDFKSAPITGQWSEPLYPEKASVLIDILKKYSVEELMKLMEINRQLAILSHERIQSWSGEPVKGYSRQAIGAFKGEVYHGLMAKLWSEDDFSYAQTHLLLLSGLYGVLRPLDLINPYRLEVGAKLRNPAGDNLYEFWGQSINKVINSMLQNEVEPVLINLCSNEYFKSIVPRKIKAKIISPVFKEFKNGEYRVIVVYTKKARGSMARFIIQNKLENLEYLKAFDTDGYMYNQRLSTDDEWVFTRE